MGVDEELNDGVSEGLGVGVDEELNEGVSEGLLERVAELDCVDVDELVGAGEGADGKAKRTPAGTLL